MTARGVAGGHLNTPSPLEGPGAGSPGLRAVDLPPAVSGERRQFETASGRVSYYTAGPDRPGAGAHPPLILVHSVNAAAAAHEVRPLYERYRQDRRVYAIDLPGYGFSERAARRYTPRLMTDGLQAVVDVAREAGGGAPVDVLALSLSCEFAARAAGEQPRAIRSLALVAPTGFNRDEPLYGAPGTTRGAPWLHRVFSTPLAGRALFNVLTSRPSVRYFLEKTWGSKAIDTGLWDYSWRTARQPGAHHAPFCFLSGYPFSADIGHVYDALTQPVWMVHGVRGDFTDYRGKHVHAGRPNWRIEVFDSGAMPHFEIPEAFTRCYDAFLEDMAAGRQVVGGSTVD